MIKRILTKQTNTITGAAFVLSGAALVSRIIGLLRDKIFAHQFGAGEVLDAYYAAFRVPDLMYNLLVVGALSAGFIPIFRKHYDTKKEQAWKFLGSVLPLLGIALIVCSSLLIFFADSIIPYIVPGFTSETQALTITMARIMFISPIILGVSSVISGALQALKSFIIYSLTPIVYNLGIILGAIIFVPNIGPLCLAWGVLLGSVLHLLVQIPTLFRHGFKARFSLSFSKDIRKLIKLMLPRVISLGASQITLTALVFYASSVSVGAITVFTFATNIQYVPVGMIGISFALAAFPTLCEYTKKTDTELFVAHLAATTRKILFFIIPLTVILILLRAQIVRVIYGSGEFGWSATIETANTLAFFALSLFAQALIPLYVRAFFAKENTNKPLVASVFAMIITVGYGYYASKSLGIAGIALAFSFGTFVQFIFLWIMLRRELGSLQDYQTAISLQKMSVAAIAMTVIIQLLKLPIANLVDMTRAWGILTQGCVTGMFGLIIYGGVCSLLRVKEIDELVAGLKKRFLHFTHVEGQISEADKV